MKALALSVLVALVVLTAACSGDSTSAETATTAAQETATTAAQETTTTTPDLVVMTTTFDGEECTYDGPGELSQGDVRFINHNESSEAMWVLFGRLDEGRTFQELIDWLDATPTTGPPFVREAVFRRTPGGESWEGVRYLGPGLIVAVCASGVDDHAYYGSGITVTE